MKLSKYVDWIIDVNVGFAESKGTTITSVLSTAAFGFGLIEEVDEFQKVINTEKAVYEAGDVLAYVVLLLSSLKFSRELIVITLDNILLVDINCYPDTNVGLIASELKRYFRGDDDVDMDSIVYECSVILDYCCFIVGHDLELIAKLNQLKLENRWLNKGTFIGRGDR